VNIVTAPYNSAAAASILNWKIQNAIAYLLNNTIVKQDCDLQYYDAVNNQYNAQLNYVQALLASLANPNNVTLQLIVNITETLLQNCYTRVMAANQTKISADEQYQQALANAQQVSQDCKDKLNNLNKSNVESFKQQCIEAGVANVTQQISNEIETFCNNTTVDSCDFSDLDSSNPGKLTLYVYLTLNSLNQSDVTTMMSNIQNVFGNCLVAEGGIPPKALNVTVYASSKRSTSQVTAAATVTNPTAPVPPNSGSSSTGSGSVSGSGSPDTTNTMPYVVGGVVGGLVVIAIVIVVIVVVVKKREGEMV